MSPGLLEVEPKVLPPLDPAFRPAYLGNKAFVSAAHATGRAVPLEFALWRPNGDVSRFRTVAFSTGAQRRADNLCYAERILKYLLWQKGGARIFVAGPPEVGEHLSAVYRAQSERAFDAEFMGNIYELPFGVVSVAAARLPAERETSSAVGRHLAGCRIGFDAGGSDRKVAAVIDGKEVFSCEVVWHPKSESDPQYHFDGVDDSIRRAAEHLPRIDAIGVSSAGIYIAGRTRVASLFRRVPPDLFERRIKPLYLDIAKKWGDVPVEVANDGDVAALAGAMSLNDQPVMGWAMGTSLASGYVDGAGHIAGWLNELAFAPFDYARNAPMDREWSGDRGTGVNYFSQDAVIRLAPRAGIELAETDSAAAKLAAVQRLLESGDDRARLVFETIGTYLGYAVAQSAEFYRLKHVLVLGRVTSGKAGGILVERAKQVLAMEAPELVDSLEIHLPDEMQRRVGQAIAAASLPAAASNPPGSAA